MSNKVILTLSEYSKLKRESDGHFDVIKKDVEKMLEENEKLKSGILQVTINRYGKATILNTESEFYDFVNNHFQTISELKTELAAEKKITYNLQTDLFNFKNSRWGKFLAFFGITV